MISSGASEIVSDNIWLVAHSSATTWVAFHHGLCVSPYLTSILPFILTCPTVHADLLRTTAIHCCPAMHSCITAAVALQCTTQAPPVQDELYMELVRGMSESYSNHWSVLLHAGVCANSTRAAPRGDGCASRFFFY